jgi:hypothetical protein
LIDISKEHVTSIFWVEEEAKQETSMKQVAIRGSIGCLSVDLHGVVSQKVELFIITSVRTSNPT